MSVQNEIDRIITAVEAAHTKVKEKGGTTAAPYLVGTLASAIDTIPKAVDPKFQSKTVSPATSAQTVKPDSGYDGLSQVTVNAMPTGTQATPSISVSSGGLITASATQSAGYVSAGTKSATKQLTTQSAQTITPGTSNKTIASGRYLTGTQTIKGDANLVAGNIKSGVSIFGVTGNHQGGEDVSAEVEEYTEQLNELETTINTLPDAEGGGVPEIVLQEKTVDITDNGTTEVLPDEGFALSKVTVNVDVESGGGSGGADIETCTFVLTTHGFALGIEEKGHTSTVYRNGKIDYDCRVDGTSNAPDMIIENVVCGSIVTIRLVYATSYNVTNCERLGINNGVWVMRITAPKGGTSTLSVSEM